MNRLSNSPRAIYLREWRKNNPEEARERDARARSKKKDKHKIWARAWADRNAASEKIRKKELYQRVKNTPEEQERRRLWRLQNKEKMRSYRKAWRETNSAKVCALTRKRQLQQSKAMPVWACQRSIEFFYEMAAHVSKRSGVKHHVDHITPLQSPIVSGLHCEWNLQVIPATENIKKSNQVKL